MNCSSKTISRCTKEYNLTTQRTQITKDDLDQVTLLCVQRNAGQKSYSAVLLDQEIHISCQKVFDSLLQVNLSRVMQRFKKAIKHRRYHVPGPNSMWHLDGYHKLIRWGIVIHWMDILGYHFTLKHLPIIRLQQYLHGFWKQLGSMAFLHMYDVIKGEKIQWYLIFC